MFISTIIDTDIPQATTEKLSQKGDSPSTIMIAVGVAGTLLLVVVIFSILTLSLVLWYHKRRTHKSEIDHNSGSMREDASYSTLERETRQQIQPQASTFTELYDQIHLSPSTGQTDLISKTESETAEGISTPLSNIYSSVDTENFQHISSSKTEKSKSEDATYAVVDKKKKKKKFKGASDDNANKNDSTKEEDFKIKEKREEEVKAQEQPSIEDTYAVVHKKPKKSEEQEETPPPIPASTVESLYTAIQKKPQ